MTHTEQAYMLAWLAKMINAQVIVEAGTYKGKATKIFAEVNPQAMVWSADIVEHPVPEMPDNVRLFHGDFVDMLKAVPEVDFAYIDASGATNKETWLRWNHFVALKPKLSRDAIVAWDDTLTHWDGSDEIREFAHINIRALKGLSLWQNG